MLRTTEILVLGMLATLIAACDDPTANFVEPPEAGAEAAAGEGGGGSPACLACIMAPDMPGPGCGTEFAACQANVDCAAQNACVLTCFVGQSATATINCAILCGNGSSVVLGSPAYTLASNLFLCSVEGVCGSACTSP